MIVNTHRLFATLLSRMQISAVCDVGSMNGADARLARLAWQTVWCVIQRIRASR
jgi:hypothetical protein